MSRRRRGFVAGASVHVIKRGHNGGPVFRHRSDYQQFVSLLRAAAIESGVGVHVFTLMTTHVHLLATPADRDGLPGMMKTCCEQFTPFCNRRYQRSGTIWNGRYDALLVDTERYWLTCSRYIERNPVAAGIVADPSEYEWSSYRTHALGEPSDWLVPHRLYLALGSTPELRQAVYRALCGGPEPGSDPA
jgi:putative transposase